jgi:hypothetical protein
MDRSWRSNFLNSKKSGQAVAVERATEYDGDDEGVVPLLDEDVVTAVVVGAAVVESESKVWVSEGVVPRNSDDVAVELIVVAVELPLASEVVVSDDLEEDDDGSVIEVLLCKEYVGVVTVDETNRGRHCFELATTVEARVPFIEISEIHRNSNKERNHMAADAVRESY